MPKNNEIATAQSKQIDIVYRPGSRHGDPSGWRTNYRTALALDTGHDVDAVYERRPKPLVYARIISTLCNELIY